MDAVRLRLCKPVPLAVQAVAVLMVAQAGQVILLPHLLLVVTAHLQIHNKEEVGGLGMLLHLITEQVAVVDLMLPQEQEQTGQRLQAAMAAQGRLLP